MSEYYIEIYLRFERILYWDLWDIWVRIHSYSSRTLSLSLFNRQLYQSRETQVSPTTPSSLLFICFLSAFYIIILILNRDILRPRAPQLTQKWMLKVSIEIGVIIRAWLDHDSILCLAWIDVKTLIIIYMQILILKVKIEIGSNSVINTLRQIRRNKCDFSDFL